MNDYYLQTDDYTELCDSPEATVRSLAAFIRPNATEEQIAAAIDYVRPDLKHF